MVKRTFGTALQLMYEYPQYTYTQSAAAYNEWMAQKYPDMNAEIAQRIKEGRWEVVGGMWVEPDLNMPDGESLVRQLLVGKRWYKQAYGVDVRIGWNPDSFGYTWQLPQIYKKSGVDYFVTQKMTWNDTNQLPFKLFWWESPDGSKVLAYFPHDYANDNLNPMRLSADLVQARQRATGLTDMMDLYGIGDHGGGPTRAILDQGIPLGARRRIPPNVMPKMQFGIAQTLLLPTLRSRLRRRARTGTTSRLRRAILRRRRCRARSRFPRGRARLYFEYHRGVMTTQANHKRNMRERSIETLNAEKWASLAWLDGKKYPADELTEDWKKVLFNQFHDLAAGSGIGVIYKDAQKDYDVVRWSTNEVNATSLESLTSKIDSMGKRNVKTPQSVIVFNPLGWERSGDVTVRVQIPGDVSRLGLADAASPGDFFYARNWKHLGNHEYEITVPAHNVPALGYKAYRVLINDELGIVDYMFPQVEKTGDIITVNNRALGLDVRKKDGCIVALRHAGQNLVADSACANQLQFFKDTPKDYDAWNIDPGTLDVAPKTIEQADSVELIHGRSTVPSNSRYEPLAEFEVRADRLRVRG